MGKKLLSIDVREALIREVEKHEVLYNKAHKRYLDAESKDRAWKSIAAKIDLS